MECHVAPDVELYRLKTRILPVKIRNSERLQKEGFGGVIIGRS